MVFKQSAVLYGLLFKYNSRDFKSYGQKFPGSDQSTLIPNLLFLPKNKDAYHSSPS